MGGFEVGGVGKVEQHDSVWVERKNNTQFYVPRIL